MRAIYVLPQQACTQLHSCTVPHISCSQVFLGQSGGLDSDGNELPRLVYVSREKRPGFQHHKKAGAMNSLVRSQMMYF